MSNSVPSATPVHSTDDESIWDSDAVVDKMRSAPEHGRITDEYDVTSVILGVLYEGMMDLPEDDVLIRLLSVVSCSPNPRIKYRPYPEACVEFLQDKALKKVLQNASASGDYREVMSFRRCSWISVRLLADNLQFSATLLDDSIGNLAPSL